MLINLGRRLLRFPSFLPSSSRVSSLSLSLSSVSRTRALRVSLSVSPLAARDSSAALTIILLSRIYSAIWWTRLDDLELVMVQLIHCQRRSVQEDIPVDISLPLFLLQWRWSRSVPAEFLLLFWKIIEAAAVEDNNPPPRCWRNKFGFVRKPWWAKGEDRKKHKTKGIGRLCLVAHLLSCKLSFWQLQCHPSVMDPECFLWVSLFLFSFFGFVLWLLEVKMHRRTHSFVVNRSANYYIYPPCSRRGGSGKKYAAASSIIIQFKP